jgi:molecular chaperone GrpE
MPDPRDLRGRSTGQPGSAGHPAHPSHNGGPTGHPAGQPHRTRAQERIDELDVSPSRLVAEIEALKTELAASNAKADEYLAGLQRERAEFSNYRRRTAEEREQMLGLAGEDLIRKVLAIADDFDLAIDNRPAEITDNAWVEGVAAIDRKLRALLESEGVSQIEASAGIRFDPREHEAIANVPGSGRAEGEIVDVVRRGYRLRDRVIRPALVAVASGEPATSPDAAPDAAPTS